jgi:hypothetical protein
MILKPGTRIYHAKTHEQGYVVERAPGCPADATTVRYDGDDATWNTPTCKLIPDDDNDGVFPDSEQEHPR